MEQFPRPGEPVEHDMVSQYLCIRRTCPRPGVVVCMVAGEVDWVTAPRLEHAVDGVAQDEVEALVVDLSQVDFLAVAGVRALHGVLPAPVRCSPGGRTLLLQNVGPRNTVVSEPDEEEERATEVGDR